MKLDVFFKKVLLCLSLCLYIFTVSHLFASVQDIDGTSSVQWKDSSVQFDVDDSATGFVKFRAGFSVDNGFTTSLDITEPISGAVNLGPAGTTVGATSAISLLQAIALGSDATMPQGGIIYGGGHTITFDGDFVLPKRKRLKIMSDTVLDGRGNTFMFEQDAQIIVDHGVTVTLKDMKITNSSNGYYKQMFTPLGPTARVALQNVVMNLNEDIYFKLGKLYIHGDVVVSGGHKFMYRSDQPSYIAPHASFIFEAGSTFNYNPTNMSDSLVQMIDSSSSMFFDGAILESLSTPLRLTKGQLCFDNDVTLSSPLTKPEYIMALSRVLTGGEVVTEEEAEEVQSGYNITSEQNVNEVRWSTDGNFLAAGLSLGSGNELRIYRFNGAGLTEISSVGLDFSQGVLSVDWAYGSQYLAVGLQDGFGSSNELRLYSFDGTSGSESLSELSTYSEAVGRDVNAVRFHVNGRRLFVATDGEGTGAEMRSYFFDYSPTVTLDLINSVNLASGHHAETVHSYSGPAGAELAVFGLSNTGGFNLWVNDVNFSDPSPPTLNISRTVNSVSVGSALPSTNFFIAVGLQSDGGSGDEIVIYKNFISAPAVTGVNTGQTVKSLDWSPGVEFLAVGLETDSSSGYELRIYEFDSTSGSESLTELTSISVSTAQSVNSVHWSPGARYLVIGLDNDNGDEQEIRVFEFDRNDKTLSAVSGTDGQSTLSMDWTSDGKYLAVGLSNGFGAGDELRLYSFDDTSGSESLTELASLSQEISQNVNAVRFSFNGRRLFVASDNDDGSGGEIRSYFFDDLITPTISLINAVNLATGQHATSIDATQGGPFNYDFVVIGLSDTIGNDEFLVYADDLSLASVGTSFMAGHTINSVSARILVSGYTYALGLENDGGAGHQIIVTNAIPSPIFHVNTGQPVNSIEWSPDNNFLVAGLDSDGGTGKEIRIYRYDTTVSDTLSELAGTLVDTGQTVNSVNWSGSGIFLAVGMNEGIGNELRIYKFTSTPGSEALTEITGVAQNFGQNVNSVRWSASGNFLAVGISDDSGSGDETRIYKFIGTPGVETLTEVAGDDYSIARFMRSFGLSRFHQDYDLSVVTVPPLLYKYNTGGTVLTDLVDANITTGQGVNSLDWTPDRKYLAAGLSDDLSTGDELRVYEFDDTSGSQALTELTSLGVSGQAVNAVHWSSDGLHLAVGLTDIGSEGDEVRIYTFDNTSGSEALSELIGLGVNTTQTVNAVRWRPDGFYLAVGLSDDGSTGNELVVYEFDGTTLTALTGASKDIGQAVNAISWSPDGAFLAVGLSNDGSTQNELRIYEFDGTTLTELSSQGKDTSGQSVNSVDWSPDGTYLAAGLSDDSGTSSEVRVYRFKRRILAELGGSGVNVGQAVNTVGWSLDGTYLVVGATTDSGSGKEIRVYQFDGLLLTEVTEAGQNITTGQSVASVNWSPDGGYLAAGFSNDSGSGNEIRVYRFGNNTYSWDTQGFVFGDSSVTDGSCDLNVRVLGGAHVAIKAYVEDDSTV